MERLMFGDNQALWEEIAENQAEKISGGRVIRIDNTDRHKTDFKNPYQTVKQGNLSSTVYIPHHRNAGMQVIQR
ncbi:hypothetical protein [Lyngbya aestuarii]|uniref:hypothetical protein n=1 Tax=Lyngbya aestuarii TaxID=118322 RepID=UPI00403D8FC9